MFKFTFPLTLAHRTTRSILMKMCDKHILVFVIELLRCSEYVAKISFCSAHCKYNFLTVLICPVLMFLYVPPLELNR